MSHPDLERAMRMLAATAGSRAPLPDAGTPRDEGRQGPGGHAGERRDRPPLAAVV